MRVGIDAQPVAEVHQALVDHGDHYRRRLFTEREVEACGGWGAEPDRAAEGLAARFAAKEAALKALRVTDRMPAWTDIEVIKMPGGWPILSLWGFAQTLADEEGLSEFDVSLTHTGDVAVAVVIAT